MKIYDISVALEPGMHVFPGDPTLEIEQIKQVESAGYALHRLHLGNHAGTHVDAPSHFLSGAPTVTDLPLEAMNGRARVVQIRNREKITIEELEKVVLVDDFRILFKTMNSRLWSQKTFSTEFVYLTEEAAHYLADNGIKLVGIDYLSIDRYGDETHPAHKTLLSNGIVILEGIDLSQVDEGEYEMSCLPLRLKGLDGAPARVILKG